MSKRSLARISNLALMLLLHGFLTDSVGAAENAQTSNPIGRVARLFNPKLVQVEDRIDWLQGRLRTLAVYSPRPLKEGMGWRAGRLDPEGGDPSLTLDLHDVYPLSEIYLIPAQPQPGDSENLFPLQFRVEASRDPDFSQIEEVFDTGSTSFTSPGGYPVRIPARDIDARFVRVIVHKGQFRGIADLAALSEIVVISGGEPVSFGATVSTTQSMDIPGGWESRFINDGRSPLGVWETGNWTASRGDLLEVSPVDPLVEWVIDLGGSQPVDRVVLFPYMLPELAGLGILPGEVQISISDSPTALPAAEAPLAIGGEVSTPLTLPQAGAAGRYVIIRSEKACQIANRMLQAMSEIEVWSQGRNHAAGKPVTVRHQGIERTAMPELTDGLANGLQIFPIGGWLMQLTERAAIESERTSLAPVRSNMATESELNATWGASVAIGLTFLIPVAIVERRRLVSRNQIDRLRRRIASDLHDDIGSNLGSISLIARSAKRDLERLHGPDAVAQDLGEMEIIARESSLAMRDIVWLLERRQDTIGDFVQRMRDTASRLLRDIDYTLTCRSNRTAAKMTLDAKRHLFLFYKEALHNLVKHSGASEVTVRVYDRRDCLVMEVADNGVGLPRDKDARPAAVRKLTDRAAVLDGELEIESTPGHGTLLRLAVKRSNLVASKAAA